MTEDAFSKWIELIPLKTKSMEEVTEAIIDAVNRRHEGPKVIVIDRGPEFANGLSQAVHVMLNTKYILISGYNAQSNG